MTGAADPVAAALSEAVRADGGRIVAVLARRFRDLDVADDALQDACEEAWRSWSEHGVPRSPGGWLATTARRRAIDRVRRAGTARRGIAGAAAELVAAAEDRSEDEEALAMTADEPGIADDQLRLVLLCCHPALAPEAQVALTLRLVGGLSTAEIAAGLLLSEATVAQRVVRAKRKIRAAGIPLRIPPDLDDRLATVLTVLYLVFNEGYLARGGERGLTRVDLVEEAVRLTALLVDLVPDSAEAKGLLALELFHRARAVGRVDDQGGLVLLEDQDRSRWDLPGIEVANRVLTDALGTEPERPVGPLVLQALIAGHHANARTAAETDWPAVVGLYDELVARTASPVARLNRAVAVAMADGPHVGLAELDELPELQGYHLFHASRAELLLRVGDRAAAVAAFTRSIALVQNPAERRHLERRLASATA